MTTNIAKEVHANFINAGQKAGLEMWRVENFQPVPVPKDQQGRFYSGDTYLVLKTTVQKSGSLAYALHFWLGKESSQDEQGAAAIFAVELDGALGGKAIQYREAQGSESDLFLSYFRPAIVPLAGGHASGFRKVEAEAYQTRLFVIKGTRYVRVKEVPVARASLNQTDVFVLDTPNKVFLFNGANSGMGERAKGLEIVQHIKDVDHEGQAATAVVDAAKLGTDADSGEFWEAFGGYAPIPKGQKGALGEDDNAAANLGSGKLYCISHGSMSAVPGPPFKKEMLETGNCYILDCGGAIYTWTGKLSALDDRKAAAATAQDILVKEGRPNTTRIVRVPEGFEDPIFISSFDTWPKTLTPNDGRSKMAVRLKMSGVDVKGMVKGAVTLGSSAEETSPPLVDPNGKLEVYRINDFAKEAVTPAEVGVFYSGDCYLVVYKYRNQERKADEAFIFIWLGRNSTTDERGTAAILAVQIDDGLRGKAAQVRIVQGKETKQFIALFKGGIVILKGGHSSGFRKVVASSGAPDDTWRPDAVALFQVRGTTAWNMKAVQVDPVGSQLNSSDCFVLQTPANTTYTWAGNHSTQEEQNLAQAVAQRLKPGATIKPLKEGMEVGVFWDSLGGKVEYPSQREGAEVGRNPRMFEVSNATGTLKANEVFNYAQEDLNSDNVIILDAWSEVFVWVGQLSNEAERAGALQFAQEYIKQANKDEGMSLDVPIVKVSEGSEPPSFTSNFTWDTSKAGIFVDPYEKRLAALQNRPPVQPVIAELHRRRGSVTGIKPFAAEPSPGPSSRRPSSAAGAGPMPPSAAAPAPVAPLSVPTLAAPSAAPPAAASQESLAGSQRMAAMAALQGSLMGEQRVRPPSNTGMDAPMHVSPLPMVQPVPAAVMVEVPVMPPVAVPQEMADLSIAYERLTVHSSDPAEGIDITKREIYLSDEAFQSIFGMSKADFAALPQWKREQKKKAADLF